MAESAQPVEKMILVPHSLLREIVDQLAARRWATRELELKYEGKPLVFERDDILAKIWGCAARRDEGSET